METTPLISFVIPCFNQAQYLKEALDSLRRQSRPEWEAIVVDDGSTSGDAAAVVREVADDRVRFIQHPVNRERAAARNTAIRAARAEIIMPLDADDRVVPEFVRENLAAFADPDVAFVYFDARYFGTMSGVRRFGPFQPADIGRGMPLGGWSAFRLQVWKDVGGYCEDRAVSSFEDWDFWIGVVAKGFRGKHIPVPLYEYRQVANGMTVRLKPNIWRGSELIFQRHREFLDKHQVADAFLRYGYDQSVWAHVWKGNYRTAVSLAAKSRQYGSTDPTVLRLAGLEPLPQWAVHPCAAAALLPMRLRRIRSGGLGIRTRLRRLVSPSRQS